MPLEGIVLGGRVYPVAGVTCRILAQVGRVSERRLPIRGIVIHTSTGEQVQIQTGIGASPSAENLGHVNATTTRRASWDYSVDADSVVVQNDPVRYFTWHASQVNPSTIGIELTVPNGVLDTRTLANCLALVDTLTGELSIQRQIPWVNGAPTSAVLDRTRSGQGSGTTLIGLYGHDNAAERGERGPNDSPDAVWTMLHGAGYEGFDFNAGADLATWRARQAELHVDPADGIPGGATAAALALAGHSCGLWVARPIGCPGTLGDAPASFDARPTTARGRAVPLGAQLGERAAPSRNGPAIVAALAALAGAGYVYYRGKRTRRRRRQA